MKRMVLIGSLILQAGLGRGAEDDGAVKALSLVDYENQAIEKGIQGRLTEFSLQTAGYERGIQLRETNATQLTAGHVQTRGETRVNGNSTVGDSHASSLRLDQSTLLGTDIDAQLTQGTANKPGFTASATQPLYLFTHNASLRKRKRAEINFANARDTYDATILSLRAEARSLYYAVMQGEESIRVEERKAASSKKLVEITQALVDAGRTAPVETMRAKIRAQTDERQLQNALTQRDQAILNAKNFVMWPLEEPLLFPSKLQFKPLEISVDRLVDFALLHRPELRSLRRQRDLARLSAQEAAEPTQPGLSLNGTYGYNELSETVTRSWSWTGRASWMFFDSFLTRDRVRQARIGEWVSELNIMNSERATRVNVQNAYLDVKRAEKQIQEFQFSREQTKRNVDVLRLRFQNGLERLIDVFDAENEMRNLDNEYLSLLVGYNRAKDNLSRLIGANVEGVQ